MKPMVGVIGLGIMGGAMAKALLNAGFPVAGYDVKPKACADLKKAGGRSLASAAAVAKAADILILSLATSRALASVSSEIASSLATSRRSKWSKSMRKVLVIDTCTLPIADKEASQALLARAGATMLDCPISGTAARMKEGTWTIFVSGPEAACKKALPILNVFTQKTPHVGAFGSGSKMKFIANHLVAIYNVAIGETMTFARKMGLDAQQVWDLFAMSPVIGNGVFKLRGKFMVDRKYLPATMKVEVWQKDMQVIGDMAKSVDCPTPLFTTCMPIYTAAMGQGLSQHDTASVCEVLDAAAGGSRRKR
ncbi:MAG TPA: NAD(P)-dependent oxidoreductase [Pseudolabrys sp.]|jgi:3-hydroxyisobutyrate dehydrogenase-like beta-hydroxyacid dehydrogenase